MTWNDGTEPHTLKARLDRAQERIAELERERLCVCGHGWEAHTGHTYVPGHRAPDHCACCPGTCYHYRPLLPEAVRKLVQAARAFIDPEPGYANYQTWQALAEALKPFPPEEPR